MADYTDLNLKERRGPGAEVRHGGELESRMARVPLELEHGGSATCASRRTSASRRAQPQGRRRSTSSSAAARGSSSTTSDRAAAARRGPDPAETMREHRGRPRGSRADRVRRAQHRSRRRPDDAGLVDGLTPFVDETDWGFGWVSPEKAACADDRSRARRRRWQSGSSTRPTADVEVSPARARRAGGRDPAARPPRAGLLAVRRPARRGAPSRPVRGRPATRRSSSCRSCAGASGERSRSGGPSGACWSAPTRSGRCRTTSRSAGSGSACIRSSARRLRAAWRLEPDHVLCGHGRACTRRRRKRCATRWRRRGAGCRGCSVEPLVALLQR